MVIISQLRKHALWIDVIGVVTENGLAASYITSRPQRRAADLPHPLGNLVRHSKKLLTRLIEKQVIDLESIVRSYANGNSWSSYAAQTRRPAERLVRPVTLRGWAGSSLLAMIIF